MMRRGGGRAVWRSLTPQTCFPVHANRLLGREELDRKVSELAVGSTARLGDSELYQFRGPSLGATASVTDSSAYVALDQQAARAALRQLEAAAAEQAAARQQSAARRSAAQKAGLEQMQATRKRKGSVRSGPRSTEPPKKAPKLRTSGTSSWERHKQWEAEQQQRRAAAAAVEAEKRAEAPRLRDERRQGRGGGRVPRPSSSRRCAPFCRRRPPAQCVPLAPRPWCMLTGPVPRGGPAVACARGGA